MARLSRNRDYDLSAFDEVIRNLDNVISDSVDAVGKHIIDKAKESFRTKSFENEVWKGTLFPTRSTGNLANSLTQNKIGKTTVQITSSLPYGNIQNYGGKIRITDKMRKFFWAKFKSTGDSRWKGLALSRKQFIKIPKRTFIGDTPKLQLEITDIVVTEFNKLTR